MRVIAFIVTSTRITFNFHCHVLFALGLWFRRRQWIVLSQNRQVPISLLILSRSFALDSSFQGPGADFDESTRAQVFFLPFHTLPDVFYSVFNSVLVCFFSFLFFHSLVCFSTLGGFHACMN